MFKFVPVGLKFPKKLLKLPSFRQEYTGHDLTVLNGGCSPDDMEMVTAISEPDGMHFKISVQLLPSSLWSVELNHWSTLTHDTMLPCWVVQNWSCQSRGRSLELINPSRPWCDFFFSLSRGWAGWQPVGWLVSLTSRRESHSYCNLCKCLRVEGCLTAAAEFT